MNHIITPEIKEVMTAVHYRPAVSVILPFDPQKTSMSKLSYSMKVALHKVEDELMENFPADKAITVIKKLRKIIDNINYKSNLKSVAIYVSPVFEKVLYLDVPVEEKIIVDESFEIRDLVYSRKQLHKYLVLLLTGKESRIFLGNEGKLVRIIPENPETIYAYINEAPERVANFSDVKERREMMLDKFLRHIDRGLDNIINNYHLPLFVMGTEKVLGHFNKITKHQPSVVRFIHGNYMEFSIPDLAETLEPYIDSWKKEKEKELLNVLDTARSQHKIASGMQQVWKEAMLHHGKLLVLEKNFMFPAQRSDENSITALTPPYNELSYIRDAVDDVLEKVLQNGGDVEFVDEGMLSDYNHIALVQHY